MRIGFGYDAHRFAEGRKLVLGGIEIDYCKGLQGHSDADVLVHAIIDALLGAAAAGDIGTHFLDSDSRYKGISSLVLLDRTKSILLNSGYTIGNIDSTVIAQEPKMEPYIRAMKEKIAGVLGIDTGSIGIKAKTGNGLGFAGNDEGIAAYAVCFIIDSSQL